MKKKNGKKVEKVGEELEKNWNFFGKCLLLHLHLHQYPYSPDLVQRYSKVVSRYPHSPGSHQHCWLTITTKGDSYFDESWNFKFNIVSNCSILFTYFGTVFVSGRLEVAEEPLLSGQMLILRCGV